MSSSLVLTAIIAVLFAIIYLYVQNVFAYWKKRKVPYLKPSFPFGNLKKSFTQKLCLFEDVQECYNSTNEPYVGIFTLLRPALLVRDSKIIQEILMREFSSFYHRGATGNENVDPLSANILLQNGETWKKNRMRLSPTFTSGKLKGYFDVIVSCGGALDNHIEKFVKSGETIEIRDVLARFATNVIASVAFGIEIDCIKDPNDVFHRYGRKFFDPNIKNSVRNVFRFLVPTLAKLFRIRFADKDVGEFFIETVQQNLEYREKNNHVRKDFFQLLMQMRNGSVKEDGDWSTDSSKSAKNLTINEMTAQAYLFFVGGYESTSTTMTFFMYEMARNQDIQQKAYEDIGAILEKHDGKLTYESINEMKYIETCLDGNKLNEHIY